MEPDEINRLYRTKDIERWQSSPFILGYEIKLSKNPKLQLPICHKLAGSYPKWFLFTEWGQGCGCFVVPVLPNKEEFDKFEEATMAGNEKDFCFANEIKDVPENFKQWVKENQNIKVTPDFVKANFINGDIKSGLTYAPHKRVPLPALLPPNYIKTMGLFDQIPNTSSNLYAPKSEQEAWITIMYACMAADGIVSDAERDQLSRTVIYKTIFNGHNTVEYYKTALLEHTKLGSKQLINQSVSKIPLENRATLFAITLEILLFDGILTDADKAVIEHLAISLNLDHDLASRIIEVILIRNKDNVLLERHVAL
jgi:uncharacterized tellurite resistance protein B-like protein